MMTKLRLLDVKVEHFTNILQGKFSDSRSTDFLSHPEML